MALKFKCPNCGDEKTAKYLLIGDEINCRICGFEFLVPDNAEGTDDDSSIFSQIKKRPEIRRAELERLTPKNVEPTPWGIKSILKFLLAYIFLIISLSCFWEFIISFLTFLINPELSFNEEMYIAKTDEQTAVAVSILGLIVPVMLIYYSLTKRHHQKFFEVLRLFKPRKEQFTRSLKIALVVIFSLVTLETIITLTPLSKYLPDQLPIIEFIGDTYFEVFMFSLLALLAPFSEELIFRGYIFQGLRHSFGQMAAAIIVTLVFILLHGAQLAFNPIMLSMLSIVAVVLMVVRIKTDNLTNCVIIHFVYNASLVLIMWISIIFLGLEETLKM